MAAIVVPAYKPGMDADELLSFTQLNIILGKYPIVLACPHSMDVSAYKAVCPKLITERFGDNSFANVDGYNSLLLTPAFYKRFSNFNFILLCQLDAYVFKDEMVYWCGRGFDFIGAPWFENWHDADNGSAIVGVGNGGFSLRNVGASIRVLHQLKRMKMLYRIYSFFYLNRILSWSLVFQLLHYNRRSHISQISLGLVFSNIHLNEDAVFGMHIPAIFGNFKVAPVEDASRFAFEVNPHVLFKRNGFKLPFGCHAWKKYGPDFWSEYIK